MPYKETPIEKMYYSIGEVAEMFDVNQSLIRFWEKEFDILQPKKNTKGNRKFDKSDIENFKLIYHLVKEKGHKLDAAKVIIRKNPRAAKEQMEAVQSLLKVRDFLVDLKENINE